METKRQGNKPLEGIKVVELSAYVAAPATARLLVEMGAEVIKVETLSGDPWRAQGRQLLNTTDEENPYFDLYNSGKKCISINIKSEKGKEALLKLIADADVFLTNTREKSLIKLGLDAKSIREMFPRIIYASVDGYGPKGPDAGKPGFDNLAFWARSGFLIDAPYKTEHSRPIPPTSGFGDCVTSAYLFAGISLALYKRSVTGEGDTINVSLYNAGIWCMSAMLLRADPHYGGHFPVDPLFGDPLTYTYQCSDGEWVTIAERSYVKDAPIIYGLLGVADEVESIGIDKDNFVERVADLVPILQRAFLNKTASEWMRLFSERDLVIEKLAHFKDVLVDEQAWANGFVESIENRNGYKSTIACQPIRMASFEKENSKYSSLVGEDTVEILKNYGYAQEEIDEMYKDGSIG